MKEKQPRTSLGRTLGLKPSLAIGIGTMVGAGIFIFPGIAAGQAGPAAILSFVLGGGIALLVALCTAELASAMPNNGGAYYFISRSLGSFPGALAGISQWLGLMFAAAFYLTGFGGYLIKITEEAGFALDTPVTFLALGAALLLTTISVLGTKNAGKLQNFIVLILVALLSILFFYGLLKNLGFGSESAVQNSFMPMGFFPVLSTTALIFTSYLGFAQIATVAGEIKQPHKNLPRALIGSVIIVTLLYSLATYVSTMVIPYQKLGELRETAMVEVARQLASDYGALVVLIAGLMATLSSANASILSSSRAIYALGKDEMIPNTISKINKTFETPHLALILTGLPIAALTLYNQIAVLAEVASFLHLVIYAGMCISLIWLKRKKPLWYLPTFRVSAGYLVATLGAIFCISLIPMMQIASIIIGSVIMIVSAISYYVYIRPITLSHPDPPHFSPSLRKPKVVAAVNIDDVSNVSIPLLKVFRDIDLMILGYKLINEQVSPEQAKEKYEESSAEKLEELVEQISDLSLEANTTMLYTPDIAEGLEPFLKEKAYNVILSLREIETVNRLLLPIYDRGQVNKKMATIVRELCQSNNLDVSILILNEEEEEQEASNPIEQIVYQQLEISGLDRRQIHCEKVEVEDIVMAVKEKSTATDIVILPEADIQKRNQLLRSVHNKIKEELSCPILVVLSE